MTIPVPQSDEQPVPAINSREEPQTAMPAGLSASQPMALPMSSEEATFSHDPLFYFEDELPDAETAFVAPFQRSAPLPAVGTPTSSPEGTSAVPPAPVPPRAALHRKRPFSLPLIAMLVCGILIVGVLVMNVFAQTAPPLQTREPGPSSTSPARTPEKQSSAKGKPSPVPAPATNATGQASTAWVPQQVPAGWTAAGLQTGDAIQALRTAVTFTDREMSLDYRSVGTRTAHAGTFTAATFVMTAADRQRFQANDVRAINNTLFDLVATTRLIRLVVNPEPHLVTFAVQGQQQFAWVDVAFQLWNSHIDPAHPTMRMEGIEPDPTTKQPRIHHMTVLLLHVPAQNAGPDPAMGGTGWLVSNYGLDLPNDTALPIVQPT